jgi:membrane-anchored mycosin MYCP
VSGVAALLKGYDRSLTPAEITDRITRTADHPPQGWSPELGYGVVSPARAVGALDAGEGAWAGAGGRLDLAPAAPETRDVVSTAAPWILAVGVMVALAVLLAVPVLRRGRERDWRSGRG